MARTQPMAAASRPARGEMELAAAFADYRAGRLAVAARRLEDVLRRLPSQPDALHLLGAVRLGEGDPVAACEALGRGARAAPHNAELLNTYGSALRRAGRLDEAEKAYRAALAARGAFPEAQFNLGNLLAEAGRADAAKSAWRHAIALNPAYAAAHLALGDALRAEGRLDDAADAYAAAVASDGRCVAARVNLGNLLCRRGEPGLALHHFLEALETEPDCVEAMIGVGNVAEAQERDNEAETIYRRALALDPDCVAAHNNLGTVLKARGAIEEALACYDRAVARASDHADAHANRGHALKALGRYDAARAALDRALALDPAHREARMNRAVIRLAEGDFAGGWQDYLARDLQARSRAALHRTALPPDLAGRTIVALPDQGLGDEIFFLRFAATLRARGATVLYRASPRLAAMIARGEAVDGVLAPDAPAPNGAIQVSVGDLPFLTGMTSRADMTPSIALAPEAERAEALAARLAAFGPPPYFGVTWRAGTRVRKDGLYKEVPRAALAAALAGTPGTLVAVQRLPEPGEVAEFAAEAGRAVLDVSALNGSLEDMLALMAQLDDYVCVSNTNVHLRAAAGRPSRVLVPYPAEFRWMAAGDRSPWFPATPVYRQAPDGDWSAPLAALARDPGRTIPMTAPLSVYVGWDSREDIAYRVCRHSILRRASAPVAVAPILQDELRAEGLYTRPADPLASTEFTYTRFFVPYLAGYSGWALFCDCDFLWLADVAGLFAQADPTATP